MQHGNPFKIFRAPSIQREGHRPIWIWPNESPHCVSILWVFIVKHLVLVYENLVKHIYNSLEWFGNSAKYTCACWKWWQRSYNPILATGVFSDFAAFPLTAISTYLRYSRHLCFQRFQGILHRARNEGSRWVHHQCHASRNIPLNVIDNWFFLKATARIRWLVIIWHFRRNCTRLSTLKSTE